jgi:hypothetical protein
MVSRLLPRPWPALTSSPTFPVWVRRSIPNNHVRKSSIGNRITFLAARNKESRRDVHQVPEAVSTLLTAFKNPLEGPGQYQRPELQHQGRQKKSSSV